MATQAEDIRRENDLMMLNLKDSMNENNRKEIALRDTWRCSAKVTSV